MPSIKNLEMAAAVSAYKNIEIKKSLFSTKVVYTPTQSAVKVVVQEYAPAEGERLERLLGLSPDKMAAEIAQKGKPTPAAIGHFRLEACLSDDHQFCALQLFRFADFKNNAVFEPRFYEDRDAEAVATLLG